MADIADFANDLVQDRIDRALAARASIHRVIFPSLLFCERCEDPIPEARRLVQPGCSCCVECQSIDDQTRVRYAR